MTPIAAAAGTLARAVTARRIWPVAAAPAALALTAAVQIGLARYGDLTPWKGGGFGMFASLDHAPFRGVDLVVDAPGRSEAIAIAPSLEVPAGRAAAYPSPARLRDLAVAVVARERRRGRPIGTVTIRVWRHAFDRTTLEPTEHTLRVSVHAADGRLAPGR